MLRGANTYIGPMVFLLTLCFIFLSLSGEAKVTRSHYYFTDTIPTPSPGQAPAARQSDGNPSVQGIIKQVPKAKNQVKPAVLPPVKLPVKPKIIKPKVVQKVTGGIL